MKNNININKNHAKKNSDGEVLHYYDFLTFVLKAINSYFAVVILEFFIFLYIVE